MTARQLTYVPSIVLQAIARGYRYGFEIVDLTGLATGTVYPALRRLEQLGLVRSRWEDERLARREQRPARRYYEMTADGERALAETLDRFRALERLAPKRAPRTRPSSAS
jgi:DNA-binding PadR family transcriptional regulator